MVTLALIAESAGAFFGVDPKEIYSNRRQREVIIPRHASYYLAKKLTGKTFPEIARIYGRDHKTVMYACDQMEEAVKANSSMRADLEALETAVLASAKVLSEARARTPRDIDPKEVADRFLENPLTREGVSVDELRALALAVKDSYRLPSEPVKETLVVDLGPALRAAITAMLEAHATLVEKRYTAFEAQSRRAFDASFMKLKTLFETKELPQ